MGLISRVIVMWPDIEKVPRGNRRLEEVGATAKRRVDLHVSISWFLIRESRASDRDLSLLTVVVSGCWSESRYSSKHTPGRCGTGPFAG
jgi:hypothetical protein